MRSAFYEGRVQHRRVTPIEHAFRNRIWLAWLDLDELDNLFDGCWLWSARRAALLRFRREDHLGDSLIPLNQAVRDLVENKLDVRPTGPICLLTQLRYAGFWMNPVCFYFCYANDGETLQAVVAEVNNTPWNEQHCYVIDAQSLEQTGVLQADQPKEFHVSPFMGMKQSYRWKISAPSESLSIQIANTESDREIFSAHLNLRRREFSFSSRLRMAVFYPFQSLRVFAAIYWQALKLWWKKCPAYPHPGKSSSTPAPTVSPPPS